jgi:exopolysaccharide biosynthesis polyprenyl glycosylphosphotransferase
MTFTRKSGLLLLALDTVLTVLIFNLIGHYRIGYHGVPPSFTVAPMLVPAAFFVFSIYLIDGYRGRTDMQSLDYTSLHIITGIGAALATLLLTYAFIPADFELQSSRAVIALSFLVLIPLTLGYRHLIAQQLSSRREARSLLFVGDAASRQAFGAECAKMKVTQPVLYASNNPADLTPGIAPFVAIMGDIRDGRLAVEAIVLRESHRDLSSETAQELVSLYFGGVPTYTLELFYQVYWQKIPLYRLNPTWLFQEGFQVAREPVFERLKRASDIVLSALGLLLASPFIAVSAALVWLEDRDSIWFFQTRIGRSQVPFQLVKLRTMRVQAEDGDLYTKNNDPRITRVGGFLRKSRLDELPQLWNVLRGEMSLIGPRPEWNRLVADYEKQIPCYSYRHLVKPGITGWAQVNYPYGASLDDTLRKLEYDLYYIWHFSFLLDASIALKTVQIMLFGKGR